MDVAWTRGKSEEEKKLYVESLKRTKWVLDDLNKLIDSNLRGTEVAEGKVAAYDNPNWAFRQADANGYKRALRDIKTLTTIDQ